MNVEIAQRLAELRRERGFSQEGLAEQLGLSRQAVSKWERAESAPDMGNLIALADLYEVTLDELLRVSPEVEEDMRFESQERAESVETEAAAAAEAALADKKRSGGHITLVIPRRIGLCELKTVPVTELLPIIAAGLGG